LIFLIRFPIGITN